MTYTIVIECGEDGGWGAYVPDLPGLLLLGDTREGLIAGAPQAIRDHIAATRDLGLPISRPRTSVAEVEVSA
ncbi:MAG: type II toxin-antitoxin system HicB family antitoxin [Candidatus Eremiobacteraeota bacterium]|nr:type II toxin-antitoxin system HicB family antitoxin [Candidatus Eremiobacteraeota bacterium]